jgi:hypothetical protein
VVFVPSAFHNLPFASGARAEAALKELAMIKISPALMNRL